MMENKPVCDIGIDGAKWWNLNGKLHREDGPAVEYVNGYEEWYINGKLHRLDGPAIISSDGYEEWYINGYYITDKIREWANENDIDLYNLTEVDKALIKITWANYGK